MFCQELLWSRCRTRCFDCNCSCRGIVKMPQWSVRHWRVNEVFRKASQIEVDVGCGGSGNAPYVIKAVTMILHAPDFWKWYVLEWTEFRYQFRMQSTPRYVWKLLESCNRKHWKQLLRKAFIFESGSITKFDCHVRNNLMLLWSYADLDNSCYSEHFRAMVAKHMIFKVVAFSNLKVVWWTVTVPDLMFLWSTLKCI